MEDKSGIPDKKRKKKGTNVKHISGAEAYSCKKKTQGRQE